MGERGLALTGKATRRLAERGVAMMVSRSSPRRADQGVDGLDR